MLKELRDGILSLILTVGMAAGAVGVLAACATFLIEGIERQQRIDAGCENPEDPYRLQLCGDRGGGFAR